MCLSLPGAFPQVIVDDEVTLPFCSVLDWRRFSVRIRQSQVSQLPQLLRAIPPAEVARMQTRLAEVKRKYFLFPFNTAMAILHLRVREAQRAAAKGDGGGGGGGGGGRGRRRRRGRGRRRRPAEVDL